MDQIRIRGGRTTAILGPNGSGKTTLLRAIAGLERANGGTVRAGGETVRAGNHLAYMFQEQVFLRDSVRANLELGLRLRGVGRNERRDRAGQAARLLGVDHLLERRADRLSGGEGRRVSIARALCLRAPFVLLDEPLEGLDQRTYSTLLSDLPALLAAFDATTLLVPRWEASPVAAGRESGSVTRRVCLDGLYAEHLAEARQVVAEQFTVDHYVKRVLQILDEEGAR